MTQSEKLAYSLEQLRNLQKKGVMAIRSRDLTRTHLNRLTKNGFLKEVIKGWYIPCRPDEIQGDSTSWYISFWHFCASYLHKRFGKSFRSHCLFDIVFYTTFYRCTYRISDYSGCIGDPFYPPRMHVPPNFTAVPELMDEFFHLLENETEVSVRIVLGHFFFVYIHPYMDGNGRIGRFLMNAMFASGKYPWTIIPVDRRQQYMYSLEAASVKQNIIAFCDFLGYCIHL